MKKSSSEKATLYVSIAAVVLWTCIPFAVMVWASLLPLGELVNGIVQWPAGLGLDNYRAIFGISTVDAIFGGRAGAIARGFINSTIVAVPVAAIGTAIAILGGYALGRYRFPFKSTLLFALLSIRVLPPIAILIPYFMILSSLNLVGTHLGLVVTYLTAVIPLLTWVLMGYFASLPLEIERAARIDGCSRLQALWHIMIPMAAPGIAAAFIISFLTAWNELLFGLILTGGSVNQTLSPALLALSPTMPAAGTANLGLTMFAAASVVSTLPPLLCAMFAQRYITRLNVSDPVTVQVS